VKLPLKTVKWIKKVAPKHEISTLL